MEAALQALRASVMQDGTTTDLDVGAGADSIYNCNPAPNAAAPNDPLLGRAGFAANNGGSSGLKKTRAGAGAAGGGSGGGGGGARKFMGIPSLLTSLEVVVATPLAAAPAALDKASEALEQLQVEVSRSSASRRAVGACGGLRTLVSVSKLALNLEPWPGARGADEGVGRARGVRGKRLHADLSLRALGIMSEAATASSSLQHDLGAVGCVHVCVSYLDASLVAQGEDEEGFESFSEEAAALCEASLALLCAVCKNNVMNQRSMLLAGTLRRLAALLRSPIAPIQQAAAASIHTAGCPSGRDLKLFQDELHRCQGVPGLVRLLRLTGCPDTKRHVLQALVFACRSSHARNQVALRTCGGIKALLELLRIAPPDLQQHATAALDASLMEQHESWSLVVQAGGTELLCRLLYTTPALTQEALVRLLLNGCVKAGHESGLLAALHRADCRAAGTRGAMLHRHHCTTAERLPACAK